MSCKRLFNDNWYFTKQKPDTPYELFMNNDKAWEPVEVPHDWLIFDTRNLYESGDGWYRKNFSIPCMKPDDKYFLRFEGVYMDSTVYVNGKQVGEWKYGYSTFEFDITSYLADGSNEVVVRVVYRSPNSRWYSGAGIYRNVWLITKKSTHFISDGIYISTRKNENLWHVDITSEIYKDKENNDELFITHTIYDSSGNEAASCKSRLIPPFGSSNPSRMSLTVKNPLIWDIDHPNLYTLKSELAVRNKVIDTETQRFGFREIDFAPDKGFILNGRKVKLHGVCQHHDLGALGAAVNKTAVKRQLKILREMGVNAIRTSHNMPAVELMELTDEMGFLVVSEAFDMWERPKTAYDYARFFKDWAEKDAASWVRRDRNHPSIIMWSIGNEIYDTHADEDGQRITKMLMELVFAHDPNKNAWPTIASNYMPWENAQKCADILKLAGYNYAESYYDEHHKKYPDWIIFGSETSSTVQSRGVYHFPLSQPVLYDDDLQCSSLGNSTTSWGAINTEYCIIADRDAEYSPGHFIWSGFDYIGEPTPYETKNSYFGQVDTAGFKKDSFYIYQAEWTDYKSNPMIHIFPYWDFSEGQLIDVRVCSNAPKIELFFNDVSLGTFSIDHRHGKRLLGNWRIPYSKGVLKAVAYDENGNVIAEEIKSSFGDAAKIVLTPDKTILNADGRDLAFIEITAVDANGIAVENANNRVDVCVKGCGRLIGLDNGDSTDYDQYKGTSKRLFNGKLLAIVASTYEPGDIEITVSSPGIETQFIKLRAIPCSYPEGLSNTLFENKPSEPVNEIPVRKIELVSLDGNRLNENKKSVTVKAMLHPKNATYQDVEWRVTDDAGNDSILADVEANGKTAVLTAKADGKVRLRCATRNGRNHISMYSQLEFEISGTGEAYLDPYDFIPGSRYGFCSRELRIGNERGIATLNDSDETIIGFKNVDFGDFCSDEITIHIFSFDQEEFPIEIWEGIPGEPESELINTVIYTKGSIWNTYQEQAFKLRKRMIGIKTISFVLRKRIHIKGFSFRKIDKTV